MKGLHFLVGFFFVYQIQCYNYPQTKKCITEEQVVGASIKACKDKGNKWLWQKIVDCHWQLDEWFMRKSSTARCPENKYVENTLDESYTINQVFFNICGYLEGSAEDQAKGQSCLINGTICPYRMRHDAERSIAGILFGKNALCDLGKCIKKLFNITD